mgnify:CR=1 FL=1
MRLLARLRAAEGADVAVASWLAVECAGQRLLLPLAQAGEIFSWSGVQPVPHARSWFLGVANLRGVLNGVIDLAVLLGSPQPRTEQALAGCALLTLGAVLEVNAALLVDRFIGLRGTQDFSGDEEPVPGAAAWIGACRLDAQGERWQIIDLQTLARDAAFLNISA